MAIDNVEDITPRDQYTAAAAQVDFDYSFPIFDEDDIVVYIGEDRQVITTDYTVSGVGDDHGGTVTFLVPRTAGQIVTFYRDTVIERTTDFQQNGPNRSAALNDELDRITIVQQELKSKIGRSIRLPFTAGTTDAQQELSPLSNWFNKFLRIGATGILEAAELVSSVVPLTQSIIGQLLNPQTTAEAAAGVTPVNYWYEAGDVRRYGAVGDGTTNSTTALINAAKSADVGGAVIFGPRGLYMVDAATASGIHFNGKSGFVVKGNNATIKVIDGAPVVGGFGVLYFTNCQDFRVENLIVDANRNGRTPIEAGAYNVVIQNSCARGLFDNVRAINAVIDGFTLTSSVPGTQATYPTDITLLNCSADNAFRAGLSVICSLRLTIDGGAYSNTNGTAPEDGIDVEPDVGYTSGNSQLVIRNVRCYGNNNNGITITGPDLSPNTNVTIENVQCDANDHAHIQIAQGTNVKVLGGRFGDLVGDASTGAVHFGGGSVTNVDFCGATFHNISADQLACVRVTDSVLGRVSLSDLKFSSIACRGLLVEACALITSIDVFNCSGTLPAIQVSGAGSSLRDIRTNTTEAAGIYIDSGADIEIDGATVIDYGANASAGIQVEAGATRSIVKNVTVLQRTSIPVGTFAIRYNGVVPRILVDLNARSASVDYTAANVVSFISGTSGATIHDINPDPYRLATLWNPPSIANGAQASQDFTISGATLLDRAYVTIDSNPAGMSLTAVVSAANTVKATLVNNTGGALDLGNSNVVVWVEKRA
jgi:hypothetical protein